ncbi:hypothetical protein J2M53_10810 [Arthrobacter sp. zg-ZUI100]|uniref:hypothetical protein n=1 Tax=Arthrobacter jiangjiafuii TaxID=2817475 RepID=UPI001AED31FA|nr:hypothetical protein [Arthrobacter jiangjiafuii]MBP3036733.1 hypothetical protein [Arthrobacter jiangjiafuii]
MRSDWVAASVRARSMAQRRVGAGTCRELAAAAGLQAVLPRLADSVYGDELSGVRTLAQAQRATRRTVLWQLRVLAGWLPAGGTRLIRAAAAAFEADNILALDRALHRNQPAGGSPDFDLGGLATAWPRLRTAATAEELRAALATSPWGDPGPGTSAADVLTVVWLRRLASEAAAVRPWAATAGVLICARLLLVERTEPGERLVSLLRPLIGTGWTGSDGLQALRSSLPPASAQVLEGVESTSDLWRAEAGFAGRVEADGFSLLRAGLPGPDVVLGAMAVLAADAWRVRAALAAATLNTAGGTTATGASGTSLSAPTGTSEVLDAVA